MAFLRNTPLLNLVGILQGSVLGPLLFLIYINDLGKNIKSRVKIYADDIMIFSIIIRDPHFPQWKMEFNSDRNKQATLMLFSQEKNPFHPPLSFNDLEVTPKISR